MSNETTGIDDHTCVEPPESDASHRFLSSLDPSETTGSTSGPISNLQRRIFGENFAEWRILIDSMAKDPQDRFRKRLRRIDDCSRFPICLIAENGDLLLSNARCRDRLCPVCARKRSYECQSLIKAAIRDADSLRFITLTIHADSMSFTAAYEKLMESWRALRKSKRWKEKIRGGVWTIEVTRNPDTGYWHPHLHLLCDGDYFDQRELSDIWRDVTGDSFVVDIRLVKSRKKAAAYVAKYASKPPMMKEWPASAICEFAQGTKGKRMLHTFGDFHGRKLEENEKPIVPKIRDSLASFTVLKTHCERNVYDVRCAMRILASLGPSWKTIAEWCLSEKIEDRGEPTGSELDFAVEVIAHYGWQRDADFTISARRKAMLQAAKPRKKRRWKDVCLPFKSWRKYD